MKKKSETEGHRFKSLNYRFESFIKNKWRDWSWIQITYTTIRIFGFGVMKNKSKRFEFSSYVIFNIDSNFILKVEGQTEGFESLNYGFKFLLDIKFKFYKGDSNLLHSDSNPPFCRIIKCATYNFNNTIFKSNLSQRLVKAFQRSLKIEKV